MRGTVTMICRGGLLSSFILISYITMTTSMTLDLTELRNKVSKLKVNPRGNLWATGHFMGKKSVVDDLFMESGFENVNSLTEDRDVRPLYQVRDLQALLIQMLKTAQQKQREQKQDMLVVYYHCYYCCCHVMFVFVHFTTIIASIIAILNIVLIIVVFF
uniref:Neuromedin Ba n=1 Tax=Amphiprion percula TaxID=161767 RepID=A0A3P8TRT4_AMPPE